MTKETSIEIQKYELDKKYEIQHYKLNAAANVKVGNETLATISMLAEKFAKAGDLIPKEFKDSPEKCFVAIYKGASLGLDAFTSLQRIAVVNGRATIWGDTALALVRKSGLLELFEEEVIEENGKLVAICKVKRKGDTKPHIERFSQEDAIKAGLWTKDVYQKHPKRMLKYKARAFALRDMFADVLDGLYFKEEMEDEQMIDVTSQTQMNGDVERGKGFFKNGFSGKITTGKENIQQDFGDVPQREKPTIKYASYDDLQAEMCEIDNLPDLETFEINTKKDFTNLKKAAPEDHKKLMAMLESIKEELTVASIDQAIINNQSGE